MSNQAASIKRFTRDDIMAMARYEYARQLSIYTKTQLINGLKKSAMLPTKNVNTLTTPMIC